MKPIRHRFGLRGAMGARRSAGPAMLALPGVVRAVTRGRLCHRFDRVAKSGTGSRRVITQETSPYDAERAPLIGYGRTCSISPNGG